MRSTLLIVDSTGLKFLGEGEWKRKKNGPEYRRQWRKIHIAIDAEILQIRAVQLTTNDVSDLQVLDDLLTQIPLDEKIDSVYNRWCLCNDCNLKAPNARHHGDKVTIKSVAKDENTVIDRKVVNIQADVEMMRNGQYKKVGDSYALGNGRVYKQHDCTLYPVSEPGLYQLNRAEYKALGFFNTHGEAKGLEYLTALLHKPSPGGLFNNII